MEIREQMIAVCGLDCGGCPIRTADSDVGSAEILLGWFKGEGWLKEEEGVTELMQRGPYCRGCHGDRDVHWAANCWILECCVDDKGLMYCSECDVFPCERLTEWARQNDNYAKALNRLQTMKT
jgi:hypothetical protein